MLLNNCSAGRGPIPKVTHKAYRTPHEACIVQSTKTIPVEHQPPTPVAKMLSHRVSQLGGRPTWTVLSDTYVYSWVVDNPEEEMDEEIFRNMDHCASRGDITTLKDGSKVDFALVDAWTCVLNYRELTKANSAPDSVDMRGKKVDIIDNLGTITKQQKYGQTPAELVTVHHNTPMCA
nr:uncharacterized protein LOC109189836 [Ipomoea batatas]